MYSSYVYKVPITILLASHDDALQFCFLMIWIYETDLDEKRIFHYKLSKRLSQAKINISILKIPLYDTNSWVRIGCVSICAQLKLLPTKTA